MEKIFGDVDFVEAGECEGGSEKREARIVAGEGEEAEDNKSPTAHMEDVPQVEQSLPIRSSV
jgi:hypothetical protein